jgi:hypothetical protein
MSPSAFIGAIFLLILATRLLLFVSKFGFWNDIDVVPVIDIGEAVTLTQSSVEWARSSSKG